MAEKKIYPEGTSILKGMKGFPISILQLVLLKLGYNEENMLPDGNYGEETEKAVKEYKDCSGIEGIEEEEGVGPLMLKSLKEEDGFDLLAMSYEEEPAAQ